MKLTTRVSNLLFVTACVMSPLYAQDIDNLNKEVKELEKQLTELKEGALDVKEKLTDKEYQEKQKRVAKNIAEASARTQKNIAKGAKSEMYKRVLALHEQRATYLKSFAEGKTRAFPEVVENWEYYQSQVTNLTKDYEAYKTTESSEEKAKLATPMLLALKLIGPWLANAEHSSVGKIEATDEIVAEINRLEKRFNETKSAGPDGKMKLMTPSYSYTLKYLPVPIQFSGPPNSEVVLYSEVGGAFPNGISYISIKTDDNGLASTSWVSEGDGVATCSILYRSTELPERDKINISVKRLSLLPLEQISPIAKAAEKSLK